MSLFQKKSFIIHGEKLRIKFVQNSVYFILLQNKKRYIQPRIVMTTKASTNVHNFL
jgi:hypothetical protein